MSESIWVIEEKRNEIQRALSSSLSYYKKLSLLSDFFSLLLSTNNKNILPAYVTELIAPYSKYLNMCDVACVPLEKHNRIIATTRTLLTSQIFLEAAGSLQQALLSFEIKVEELKNVLNGAEVIPLKKNNYLFPLLEIGTDDVELYGMLDSITVKILKGKQKTFHLIPSEKEIETRIKQQVETSWSVAIAYAKKFIKNVSTHHEVIVSFDKRVGFYVGDSLGVALTLAYLKELHLFYNAPVSLTVNEGVCFTGSVLSEGQIPSIGEESITKKVELVFYSDVKTFVLPKEDEIAAEEKLRELKKEYPNRNLSIIAVTNIEDLLNRRNVVGIKKLSIINKTGKTVARNKVVTALLILVLSMLSFFYFYEYDDNPYGYELHQSGINIVNKSGKVLWRLNMRVSKYEIIDPTLLERRIKIIDINEDGENEVLFCSNSSVKLFDHSLTHALYFLSSKGVIIRILKFEKVVESRREKMGPPYGWNIYDTLIYKNKKCIIAAANNSNSYASVALIIDLKSQKIISDSLWNCGYFIHSKILTSSQSPCSIAFLICNNALLKSSLLIIKSDNFSGQIVSNDDYKLLNIPNTKIEKLFLLPTTDYLQKLGYEYSMFSGDTPQINGEIFSWHSLENIKDHEDTRGICYEYNLKENYFMASVQGLFRIKRDSLVAKGLLPRPFTDTKEYIQSLINQIKEWNGKEFVPIKK